MIKREIKRFKNKVEVFLEPFGLVALAFLFILPALAVINLSPIAKGQKINVLGVGDGKGVSTVLVGGVHDIIKQEFLTFPTEGQIKYSAQLIKRDAGVYSKPILQIVNDSSEKAEVIVNANTQLGAGSEIVLIVDDARYVIQGDNGEPFTATISLEPMKESIVYLQLTSTNDVKFNDDIEIVLVENK